MKNFSTFILKCVILIIVITTVSGLLWFPQTEGRAVNLDLINIYKDPFIIYIYISSLAFFFGLYQIFKLLNLIDNKKAFSQEAINTLKNIKFSFLSLIVFIVLALVYIRFFLNGDDPAGPTMLGILILGAFAVIATTADVFQKLCQKIINLRTK